METLSRLRSFHCPPLDRSGQKEQGGLTEEEGKKKEDVRKIKRKRRKKATNLEILFGSKIRGDVSPKAGCVISG